MQFIFHFKTEKKQLLPSLFLTSQLGYLYIFLNSRLDVKKPLTSNAITGRLLSVTEGFGGGGELFVLIVNWEFVISCKARRLRALQPLPAPRSPVNHQPLAGALHNIYIEAEPMFSSSQVLWLKYGESFEQLKSLKPKKKCNLTN